MDTDEDALVELSPVHGNNAVGALSNTTAASTRNRALGRAKIRPPPPPYFFPSYWNGTAKVSPSTRHLPEFMTADIGAPSCVAVQSNPDDPVDPSNVLCRYVRSSPISCDMARSRCKWIPQCYADDKCVESGSIGSGAGCYVRTLLVIPNQGGGTEFIRSMLKYRGFTLGGEADGPDGSVGWPTTCDGTAQAWNFSRSAMKNDGSLARMHSRFRYIVHQVRHPVRMIRSNLAFCDPRDWANWEFVWLYIEMVSPGVPYRDAHTGQFRSCLYRAMLYYLTWNRFIETVADYRVRVESLDAAERICRQLLADVPNQAMLPVKVREKKCELVSKPPSRTGKTVVDRHTHGGDKRNTTWVDLVREDAGLAAEIEKLATRYGYDVRTLP